VTLTLNHYLVLAAALFCIGLYGVLTSKNAMRVVISVELILNAVNINLAAFSTFVAPKQAVGLSFVVFLMVVAAAEFGLALAIIIVLNRTDNVRAIDAIDKLRG
jgi:NAD(P)H-quinone oxidoreductase subunit 4L